MDLDDLRYAGPRETPDESDLFRRHRFMLGGQEIDVLVTEATANVWRQTHPGADEAELDEWAVRRGEEALRERLGRDPLDFGEFTLETDVGESDFRPARYGEGGTIHR